MVSLEFRTLGWSSVDELSEEIVPARWITLDDSADWIRNLGVPALTQSPLPNQSNMDSKEVNRW
jgi:hypothetical protein